MKTKKIRNEKNNILANITETQRIIRVNYTYEQIWPRRNEYIYRKVNHIKTESWKNGNLE